jgi:hypothetical protein
MLVGMCWWLMADGWGGEGCKKYISVMVAF